MNSELLATLIGGSIALLAAIGTQLVSARLRREDHRANDRASRIAAYLAATHGVVINLGRIARAPMASKRELAESPMYVAREDTVNEQLNAIKLVDAATLISPVLELDHCLIQLRRDAQERQWDESRWIARRAEVLRDVVERVVNAARAEGGERPIDLKALADRALRGVPKGPPGEVR